MKNKTISLLLVLSMLISLVFTTASARSGSWITGYIWCDYNGNGMHEQDDEWTIDGATILILDAATRTRRYIEDTSDGGMFDISVQKGEYIIQVILPSGYENYEVRAAEIGHGELLTSENLSEYETEFPFSVADDNHQYLINIAAARSSLVNDGYDYPIETDTPYEPSETDEPEYTEPPAPTASSAPEDNAPTSSPSQTPKATKKPADSSAAGGSGGGGGGEAAEKKPTPTPDPSATATPRPTSTPRPSATPDPNATAAPLQSPSSDMAVDENAPKIELNREDHFAYVSGYEDGTIRPENNITRQEVASLFFRLLTDEVKDYYYTKTNSFSDVSDLRWSNDAISTMAHAGVISGYENGTFLPENYITRAEFATIAAKLDGGSYSGADMFSDISGHWASAYINRAAQLGWISGYDGGLFKPDAYITRAEAMTIINNILVRHVEYDAMLAGMREWRDNTPDKWYYCVVQEATNSHYYERTDDGYNEIWIAFRDDKD